MGLRRYVLTGLLPIVVEGTCADFANRVPCNAANVARHSDNAGSSGQLCSGMNERRRAEMPTPIEGLGPIPPN
jgi:hypothetical protein